MCHTCTVREEGVTLVRGIFRHLASEEWKVYGELAKNAEEWLHSTLAPRAAEEYRADPSPQKRFYFPTYEYRFEVQILTQDENEIVISLRVTLSRPKSKAILFQQEIVDRFRVADLTPLPPKRKTKSKNLHSQGKEAE